MGKAETVRSGKDIALLAIGNMVSHALEAADILSKEGIEAEVVNMRFIKPLDEGLLKSLARRIATIMTIEDNVLQGGFGAGVLEAFSRLGVPNVSVKVHGLPDEFVEHGSSDELYKIVKLDADGIAGIAKEHERTARRNSAFQVT
jgi:1-deoxy-D-xylulose-5-phosphate synthase